MHASGSKAVGDCRVGFRAATVSPGEGVAVFAAYKEDYEQQTFEEHDRGKRVKCPKCGDPITVPTEAEGEAQVAARKATPKGVDDPFAEFMVYDDSEVVYDTAEAGPSQLVVE